MMNDYIRPKRVDQTKNCGIKIDYKNCASHWSLTNCNMMHGTHNFKPKACKFLRLNLPPSSGERTKGKIYRKSSLSPSASNISPL